MGKSRPINRRPWRKAPWKGRSARPKRWNAVSSSINSFGGTVEAFFIPRNNGVGPTSPPILQLVSGQIDVEPWADEQEVTLDRLVGAFHVVGEEAHDSTVLTFGQSIYVKMGILLNEEISQGTDVPEVNMFDQESMEDYEWMWLWSGLLTPQNGTRLDGDSVQWTRTHDKIYIDSHNRRKIGQSDELNLYAQYALFNEDTPEAQQVSVVSVITDVRAILMSK